MICLEVSDLKTAVKKLYEAMFLVDSNEAASDWDGVNNTIKHMLDRAEAEVVSLRKWDDRRLAYAINKRERGTYLLCYFRADGGKIEGIERDVQLSERVMRVLILNAEHMTEDEVEKDTPIMAAEKRQQEVVERAKERAESTAPEESEAEIEAKSPAAEPEQDWEAPEESLLDIADQPEEEEASAEGGASSEGEASAPDSDGMGTSESVEADSGEADESTDGESEQGPDESKTDL